MPEKRIRNWIYQNSFKLAGVYIFKRSCNQFTICATFCTFVVHMIATQFHCRKRSPQCICIFIIKFPVDFRYPEAQRFVRNTLNHPHLKDLWPVEDIWKKCAVPMIFQWTKPNPKKRRILERESTPITLHTGAKVDTVSGMCFP